MNIEGKLKTSDARSFAEKQVLSGHVREFLKKHFSTYHDIWTRQHLRLLCELRTEFRSDIDMPIILGVIGQRMFPVDPPYEWDYEHAKREERSCDASRLTNVESIADASGIPRETVRRKVALLVSKGWVERTERGGLSITLLGINSLDAHSKVVFELQDVLFSSIAQGLEQEGAIVVVSDNAEPGEGTAVGPDPSGHQ